ncbi:hypothetical protein [Actinacidiphila oryziradicis]|nr:hypothetical protein [Actinacidiphila oryziradicis]
MHAHLSGVIEALPGVEKSRRPAGPRRGDHRLCGAGATNRAPVPHAYLTA